MTITDIQMLPMADHVRGKRSAVTCHFKCANACLGPECNTSANPHFRDIASAALTRRALLGLGAAGAVGIALAAATPGGSALAAHLHLARTVARRAEREAVELAAGESTNPWAVKYLNRLSDWLFTAARMANDQGHADVLWVPGANR